MNKIKLSISTCFNYGVSIEEQIPLITEAGFTHVSLGQNLQHFDYLSADKRQQLSRLLDQFNLNIDTIHGPQADKTDLVKLANVAQSAVDLHAPVVVMHAGPFEFGENELTTRLAQLKEKILNMQDIGHRRGIIFALENVLPGPATELVRRAIIETDSSHVGFCYDSSHDQIEGPRPFTLVSELRNRLVAVHLSDRVKEFVDHVIPGDGFIRWDELCAVLRTSPKGFPLLLEVMMVNSVEKDPSKFLQLAFISGKRLYSQIHDQVTE